MSRDDAFADFVRRHQGELYRFSVMLTGSAADGEELLQAVLVKTYSRWSRKGVAAAPLAYVRKALVNSANSTWRRSHRRHEQLVEVIPEPLAISSEPDVLLRDSLTRALQTLSRQQRAVIALRFLADLSEAQVANQLGCSLGTVKSQTSRGLARLRAATNHDALYCD